MNEKRRNALVSSVLSHAAQLAYVEESRGAFELLSRTDRLFRYLDGKTVKVPLDDEIAALRLYVEVLNLCEPHQILNGSYSGFPKDSGHSDYLLQRSSLVDAFDACLSSELSLNSRLPVSLTLSISLQDDCLCLLGLSGGSAYRELAIPLE